jgi:hypothetical protein
LDLVVHEKNANVASIKAYPELVAEEHHAGNKGGKDA